MVIDVTSPSILLSFAGALTPVITINGAPLPTAAQGRNVVPAPPGPYRIHVHLPYFLPPKLGPAEVDAYVAPGQWSVVEYKPPLWSFSKGSLGPPPQRFNGLVPMLAVIGVSVAFIVLMFVLMTLS